MAASAGPCVRLRAWARVRTRRPAGRPGEIRDSEKIAIDRDGDNPSVASDGSLVYLRHNAGDDQLLVVDRTGHVVQELGKPMPAVSGVVVSPDGHRLGVQGNTA